MKLLVSIIILGIILFLVIHHAITHENNMAFDIFDFKTAFSGNFKSHEGLILVTLLIGSGVLLGVNL